VLDFGAGQSNLPDRLREVGHRVISVDMFPPRQPHPDRLTGALRELKLEANQFDLAYSYQVFEHLPHPAPELDELFRLTRPGAYVVIHTDMETDDRAGGFADWWYVMPPDHCCFFRHRTFKQYLQNTPHRLVAGTPHLVVMSKGQTGAMR
jgi:2-polyprenyl-3-methyl-5-hydroxy-6-metoxy-1,4-benzoquinol methylase